jgi:hypothetical protein
MYSETIQMFVLRTHRKKLGPTWGQNMGLLGPKPCASGGKGNGLNGTFGRGGGDRTHDLRLKWPDSEESFRVARYS